jgi:hypothetical protein
MFLKILDLEKKLRIDSTPEKGLIPFLLFSGSKLTGFLEMKCSKNEIGLNHSKSIYSYIYSIYILCKMRVDKILQRFQL